MIWWYWIKWIFNVVPRSPVGIAWLKKQCDLLHFNAKMFQLFKAFLWKSKCSGSHFPTFWDWKIPMYWRLLMFKTPILKTEIERKQGKIDWRNKKLLMPGVRQHLWRTGWDPSSETKGVTLRLKNTDFETRRRNIDGKRLKNAKERNGCESRWYARKKRGWGRWVGTRGAGLFVN